MFGPGARARRGYGLARRRRPFAVGRYAGLRRADGGTKAERKGGEPRKNSKENKEEERKEGEGGKGGGEQRVRDGEGGKGKDGAREREGGRKEGGREGGSRHVGLHGYGSRVAAPKAVGARRSFYCARPGFFRTARIRRPSESRPRSRCPRSRIRVMTPCFSPSSLLIAAP